MNRKYRNFAVMSAMALALPMAMVGQMDQNGTPGANGYPQQGTGMSQQSGQGGSQQNGAGGSQQNGQPGMPGANSSGQGNQMGTTRNSLGAPGETGQQMMDKQFVQTVAESGIAAVALGKLATVKGGDAVKDLAQKLVDDHVAMNKDLDAVADSMGVMLPKKMSKDAQKEYETLNGLSGKDFDTEYVTYVARAHYSELHSLHMEASAAVSPDLTAEVVKEMGTMHRHVGMIREAAKAEGIVLPPRPQRTAAPATASK